MTLQQALADGITTLETAGISDAKTDAWIFLEQICKIDRNYYYLHLLEEMQPEQYLDYQNALSKRAEHIPLQYIIGEQEFMGYRFKVNSSVLVPRMETELLVLEAEKVLEPGDEVLDLCTGSGCIAISLAKRIPGLKCDASDISKHAINVAKENAKQNEVTVRFSQGDMFHNIEGTYDMIISNPPYIPTAELVELMPEVRDFEPQAALDGGEDGYDFYRILVEESRSYLKTGGYLYMETGYNQGKEIAAMMQKAGFEEVAVLPDFQGHDRIVKGRYTKTGKKEEKTNV